MRRARKYLLAGGLAVTFLLVVGLALILGSRWLTASDAVRKKISAETTRLTGGTLGYEKLALHLVPLPHLTALQVDFKIPGKVALETDSLAMYPDLLALAGGDVELGSLIAVHPTARIELPPNDKAAAAAPAAAPRQRLQETAAAVFDALSRLNPDFQGKVKGGTFTLGRPGKPDLEIEEIDLALDSHGQVTSLELRCRSGISRGLTLNATLNRETRGTDGRLKLTGLNTRALLAELPLLPGISVSDTNLDLEVVFSAQAADKVQAQVAGTGPHIRIQRGKRRLALREIYLKGRMTADLEKVSWDIKSLKVGSHSLDLAGTGMFAFGREENSLTLDAVGRRIDVAAVGRGFKSFAGDIGWVQTAFDVAREGTLSDVTCHLVTRQSADGWGVPRIRAAGRLEKGQITIPGAELDLFDTSGEVILDNQRVDFNQMRGRLPYGTFDRLTAYIDWERAATLGISTPQAVVSLETFYPWLSAFEGLQDLHKFVSTADGELALTQLELGGPLISPADWRLLVEADVREVSVTSPALSGRLHLSRGRAGLTPQSLSLEKLHVRYLDADAVASGEMLGKPGRLEQLHLLLDGAIGEQALGWLRRFIPVPAHMQVQPPLKISGMDLLWGQAGNLTVRGEITTAGDARVVADVAIAPDLWRINRFELKDGLSDLSLKLVKTGRHIDLDYLGRLEKQTLDRILQENQILQGWIEGDLKASFDLSDPRSATARGTLEGAGLSLQALPGTPIAFERFSLDCRGKEAHLQSADLIFAETPMQLSGTAGVDGKHYTFDLDLTAANLDADVLGRIQKKTTSEAGKSDTGPRERPPVDGVIHFKTPLFTFKGYTWSPLYADIAIRSDTIEITAVRADLCGISTPGTVTLKPEEWQLAFTLSADEQNLEGTWTCLRDKQLRADSLFSLNGVIESSGPPADLVKNLAGTVSFSSANGMIRHSNLLTKIFAFLNITEVFAGRTSGLGEAGLGYDAIRAHADIKAGALNFDEILLDAHAMKISGEGRVDLFKETLDVTLLVAPLKTFDRLVKRVPVVGYITGGSILSVPVRVKGSLADPETVPLPPGAVGRGLAGILERTLKSPLRVVESLPRSSSGNSLPADPETR